jgi:hypothetical protein
MCGMTPAARTNIVTAPNQYRHNTLPRAHYDTALVLQNQNTTAHIKLLYN